MAARLTAIACLLIGAGAVAGVAVSSKTEPTPFDKRLNTQVSARSLDRVPMGTPRTVVERRFGEASETEPEGVQEARHSDCRYYLELGSGTYLRVCYQRDRFVGWQRTYPEDDDFFFTY